MEICTDNLLVPLVLKWYVLYAHKALCVAYYFEAYFKSLLKEKVKLYSFSMEKMEKMCIFQEWKFVVTKCL